MEGQYEVKPVTHNGRIVKLAVRNQHGTVAIVHVRHSGDMEAAEKIADRYAREMNANGYIEVDA